MKYHISGPEVIHKEVVIIGNGPSGISLSAMLSGRVPYLVSLDHPDEMLCARLHGAVHDQPDVVTRSLAQQPELLEELAAGLEGRTTNPISLLLDALEHPLADLGVEMPPLVQWRRDSDKEIDHVVLGKGPPGGSWHTMDPNVLTLSLGSWMALPGLPYTPTDSSDSQRRASAGSVARYYQHYVQEMQLGRYFLSDVCVLSVEQLPSDPAHQTTCRKKFSKSVVKPVSKDCDIETTRRKCSFVNAFNFIRSRTKCHKPKPKEQNCSVRTCKRPRDSVSKHDLSPNRKVRDIIDRSYFSVDQSLYFCRISRDNLTDIEASLKKSEEMLVCDSDKIFPSKSFYPGERNKFRSLSFSCDSDLTTSKLCDNSKLNNDNQTHNSLINISDCRICHCFNDKYVPSDESVEMEVLCECADDTETKTHDCKSNSNIPNSARWLVTAYNRTTGQQFAYSCSNLVLANGASDLPNRLGLSAETYDLPWVLHDLRTLEHKLDGFASEAQGSADPVLVVGAGLSAADAVIATRFRSIPVLHVFRNKSVSLDKQLPENMYPEYHKVHQMMLDGGSTYPLYTALPEHTVTDISAADKTVTLLSKSGVAIQHKVSFVVILIGSRPDLSFLPTQCSVGVNRSVAIDAKSNPINIDSQTHAVSGFEGLYAIGPLAGDNFVRFIPGGALAVVSDLYNKKNW